MPTLTTVNPDSFVSVAKSLPANGRGAWTKSGIDFDYRYSLSKDAAQRIGTRANVSLDHWAVAAGSLAIQLRLIELGHMDPLADSERGIFGPRTQIAVKEFQSKNSDPQDDRELAIDGIVGTSDSRALFTPPILKAEKAYNIPNHLLLGETNHESMLDPGAVGYFIYYPDYRGIDRGMSQINSAANSQVAWLDAFNPTFALDWSAKRLRSYYDSYLKRYPSQDKSALWDAAVCAHNNPSAAGKWAVTGNPPTEAAAKYVSSVKTAIYL